MGVTRTLTYIDSKGERVSAEYAISFGDTVLQLTFCSRSAYLTPEVLARPNLTVVTGAHVTKIRFEGNRAVGVEFAETKTGPTYFSRAKKEVLLS